ncbi:MAG: hypothetical protein IPP48_00765 [Chitinophagaceae bacterium]|nr:hypothetical protein [Chitinophagaceae bacterium]
MEDKFVKFSKLYIYIFLSVLAFIVSIGLLMAVLYGFSKMVSSHPVDVAFELIVIALPAVIFSTAYIIFFKRTKFHPSIPVKYISYALFILALAYCAVALVWSIRDYFMLKSSSITEYHTFALLFLAGNVGLLFLIAIIQALTTEKEVDWRERKR